MLPLVDQNDRSFYHSTVRCALTRRTPTPPPSHACAPTSAQDGLLDGRALQLNQVDRLRQPAGKLRDLGHACGVETSACLWISAALRTAEVALPQACWVAALMN